MWRAAEIVDEKALYPVETKIGIDGMVGLATSVVMLRDQGQICWEREGEKV